jgi:hypothetical protein
VMGWDEVNAAALTDGHLPIQDKGA